MKHRLFITLATCGSLLACGSPETGTRVVGELASERIELSAESSEPIIEIAVAEGETVTAGQVLVRQDSRRAAARLAETEAAFLQLKARLDELIRGPRSEQIAAARANLEGASEELKFRQSELERIEEVHKKGLASPDALDRAKASLDTAAANRKLMLAQLQERLAGTTVEELEQAEQAMRQAAARRDGALIDLDRTTLKSPVDGLADSRLFEIGERPGQGQPVMILLGGEQPYARVYVPESIRARLNPGSEALLYVDGLTAPIDARIRWISSEAAFTPYFALTERDRGRLSYMAKVDITEDRERLPDGVPVEVEFLIERDP
ncbi:MAG: HlyD family efflux transporter periplasmic adaptor subunit [Gammaproteobacteria bacterium]|nr:HlyD family efflux transporter periplasmic adaptor subunit [Gammaproteobacteria bacterium]NNC56930.1 HlyD family efflux transporter periplasmic adaptor subunit [Woeseiaceae bacterium]